jgi:conjugal transfer pilus assembly protein TraW
MSFFKNLGLVSMMATASTAHAEYLGAIGTTYQIGEESALTMIMNKLQDKERSGELKKLQAAAVKRSLNSIKSMPPVQHIETVTVRAERLIDPTVQYNKAVTTDDGQIVVPAGAKINPLTITSLTKRLVFFDGRDPDQVEAVHQMAQRDRAKVKPILIAGSWLELTKSWKQQVYFDQKGVLSNRFGIQAVPSVISQQGDMLLCQEVPAKELK